MSYSLFLYLYTRVCVCESPKTQSIASIALFVVQRSTLSSTIFHSVRSQNESVFRVSARQGDNFPLITMLFNLNFNIKTLCVQAAHKRTYNVYVYQTNERTAPYSFLRCWERRSASDSKEMDRASERWCVCDVQKRVCIENCDRERLSITWYFPNWFRICSMSERDEVVCWCWSNLSFNFANLLIQHSQV